VLPAEKEKYPGGTVQQAVAPGIGEKWPAGQRAQLEDPFAADMDPAAQMMHDLLPATGE